MSEQVATVLTYEHLRRAREILCAPRCYICGAIIPEGECAHEECVKAHQEFSDYLVDLFEQARGRPLN